MKNKKIGTYKYNKKVVEFHYNKYPTLLEKLDIVDDIVRGVLNDTIGYNPLLFEHFVVVSIVDRLTDIKMPESFSDCETFIRKTNIGKFLKENIDLEDILKSAECKIEFEKSKLINKSKADELFEAITVLIQKFSSSFDNVDMNELMTKLQSVTELANMSQEKVVGGILEYEKSLKEKNNVSE